MIAAVGAGTSACPITCSHAVAAEPAMPRYSTCSHGKLATGAVSAPSIAATSAVHGTTAQTWTAVSVRAGNCGAKYSSRVM